MSVIGPECHQVIFVIRHDAKFTIIHERHPTIYIDMMLLYLWEYYIHINRGVTVTILYRVIFEIDNDGEARQIGVSESYLSQIIHGKRPASQKVISSLDSKMISTLKQNGGGSVWGSNPPKTLSMPPDGFEVREAHRDSNAPKYGTGVSWTFRLIRLT